MSNTEQERKVLRERPSHDMLKLLGIFGGSMVTVFVGPEENKAQYNLPRDLLCDQSKFFLKALDGDFKEGKEQVVQLPDQDPKIFSLVIQWIVSESVVILADINKSKDQIIMTREMIHQYLKFLKLVDFLQLTTSPGKLVCEKVLSMILAHPTAMEAKHLLKAVQLPTNHAIRNLFAQILAEEYLSHALLKSSTLTNWAIYQKVKDIDPINSDIFKAVGQILPTLCVTTNYNGNGFEFKRITDPTKKVTIFRPK